MSDFRISAAARLKVAVRANHRCEYCRCPDAFSASPFCVEHIIPVSLGGGSELSNLAFSCAGCNAHKYDHRHGTDPLTGDQVRLFHPRKDAWKDHFEWSADFLDILGLSKSGRATIERLKLNRKNIRSLRRLLLTADEHPPH